MTEKNFLLMIMIGMIITGSSNTLGAKWQNSFTFNGKNFNHPFM